MVVHFHVVRKYVANSNPNSQKAGNALVTPLVFQVSMGGGDCLPSEEQMQTVSVMDTYDFREVNNKCVK
uniref:SFRICE_031285 n=1 Tax=Spodoptera frugiperda TaxID=7108 RepID=A0A2H1VMF8_SPOFR